jgi:hypothetical protein
MPDDWTTPELEEHIECSSCHELNRPGTKECARCGTALPRHLELDIDPELATFDEVQEEAEEQREEQVPNLVLERKVTAFFRRKDHSS